MVGIVALRKEKLYTSIDVEFSDKNFHRNLAINDDFGVSMAALNYTGLFLASRSQQVDLDKYENDDYEMMDDLARRRKNSNIQFKPLNEQKGTKEWNFELPSDESAECLAVGSGWCAVSTSANYFRIFSSDGIQKALLCQAMPVVTITGYENLLVVVYH
jgi:hypothetical protein